MIDQPLDQPGDASPDASDEPAGPTRRRLLQAGAALGAAAFAPVALDAAGARAALAAPLAGGGTQAVAAATESLTLGFPAFWPMQTGAGAGVVYGGAGTAYATNNGYVAAPIELPAGSQIVRIDVRGDTTGGLASQPWYFQSMTAGGVATLLATITATGGPGATVGSYTGAPVTVADATHHYLELQNTSATNRARSAVIRYLPPAAGIRLLATPVRVYDSRPGNAPAVSPKTPLAGGTARAVDCTYGGAVPAGARAVLAGITLVTRSAGGFVALYRNGIGWPGTSSVNWSVAGDVIGGTQIIALDGNGAFAAYCAPGASTDLLVDVQGYLL